MNITSTDVEASIKLEELKTSVVTSHIRALYEIKELFSKLKTSTSSRDIALYSNNISKISLVQKSTYSRYSYIISEHPEAKDLIRVYISFLMDVMNNEELANKLATNENLTMMELDSKRASTNEVTGKLERKTITTSSNSIGSVPHSEDYSSVSGLGREIKKRIASKNNMIRILVRPINSCKMRMFIFVGLFIFVYLARSIASIYIFKDVQNIAGILARNINIPGAMKAATFGVRMLSYNLMLGDGRTLGKNIGIIRGSIGYLENVNMESVNAIMNVPTSFSLISPVGEYAFDDFEEKSLSDSYKKFLANLKYCVNRGMLQPNETVENILYEPHFKYFIANSKRNFDLVFNKCKEVGSNLILDRLNILSTIIWVLELFLFVFLTVIAYIVFVPLKKLTVKISIDLLRMFRYFSKDNFDQVIHEYEDKIGYLCETFNIEKDVVESLRNAKMKSFKNLKLIIAFIIVFSYIIIDSIPPIIAIKDTSNTLSIIQKSADRLPLLKGIQLYTYEVINQDRSIFLEGEQERLLKDMINRMEKIQEDLKTGLYGGPTFDSYPELDKVIKENGCFRLQQAAGTSTCESIVYDSSYGFTEQIGTLPLDELIETYLFYVKSFLNNVSEGKYKKLQFINKQDIAAIHNLVMNDNFFKLQEGLMENILGDIQYVNYELMDNVIKTVTDTTDIVVTVIIIGLLIFLFIVFFVFNSMFVEKIREMNTLITFLFLVPQDLVNRVVKFKSFLETTQINE